MKGRVERPMKPDYFPVFPMHLLMDEDYECLSREEWGSVFLLMQHQWMKDGTLPEDTEKLCRLARCTKEEFESLMARWPKLQPVDDQPGRVAIPWLLNEYHRAISVWQEFKEKQAEKGRKSADARRTKHGTSQPTSNHGSNHGLNQETTGAQPDCGDPSPVPARSEEDDNLSRQGSHIEPDLGDFPNHGSNRGSSMDGTIDRTTDEPPSHPIPSYKEESKDSSSPELDKPASGTHTPAKSERVLVSVPCVGKGPSSWDLTQEQLNSWGKAFPGVDVSRSIKAAIAWLEATPQKRKTHRGMARFFVGWLTRDQDSRASRQGVPPPRGFASPALTSRAEADAHHATHISQILASGSPKAEGAQDVQFAG